MRNNQPSPMEHISSPREKAVVLILEDDRDLAEELEFAIEAVGYATHICLTVRDFWNFVAHHEVDILVIDLTLPDGYGADVIREVRRNSEVPLIITSARQEVEERVAGIEIGADDYLGKPYNSREIIAKISRLLSRSRGAKYSRRVSRLAGREIYRFNDCVVEVQSMTLKAPDGQEIELTTLEFLLLKALVERPNLVLSRTSLVEFVHNENWHGSERKIDNLVSRLRAKMAPYSVVLPVKAIRGIGYMFTADVTTETF